MVDENISESSKAKQELVRNVAIAIPILMIAGVIGYFTGVWFLALCFVGAALPVEKMIERVFSEEISSVKDKMFTFFDAVFEKVEPTWFGRLVYKISSGFSNAVDDELDVPAARKSNTAGVFRGLGASVSTISSEDEDEFSTDLENDSDSESSIGLYNSESDDEFSIESYDHTNEGHDAQTAPRNFYTSGLSGG